MKIAVCTAITGNKDTLKEEQFDDGSDFICFTDNADIESARWTIKPVCSLFKDNNRNAKIHKVPIHQYLEEYDYWVWIDANIHLSISAKELINKYLKNTDIALFKHFQGRDCIYDEADVCIRNRLDDIEVMQNQVSAYKERGYPAHIGLFECTVILRKNTSHIRALNNYWWSEICRHSKRDQLSFNYCLHKLGIKPAVMEGNIHDNKYFVRVPHDGHKIKSIGPVLKNTKYHFNQHPSVSIVVLVRNELDYIKKCFDSIEKYTDNYELIVVDNGAGEATKEYLKSLDCFDLTIVTNDKNMGFSYGCNQGAKAAKYDYICFLNSDTVLSPQWLDRLMNAFKKKPSCGIAGPSTSFACGGNQTIKTLFNKRFEMSGQDIENVALNLTEGCIVYDVMGFCFVVKKELFDIAGGFNYKKFKLACTEEREWIHRAKVLGDCKSYWVKDSYVHHYGHVVIDEVGIDIDNYNIKARKNWENNKDKTKPRFIKNDVLLPDVVKIVPTRKARKAPDKKPVKIDIPDDNIFIKEHRGNEIYILTKDGKKFYFPVVA